MRLIDALATDLHAAVKRSSTLRRLALPLWRMSALARTRIQSPFARRHAAPRGYVCQAAEWAREWEDDGRKARIVKIYTEHVVTRHRPGTIDPEAHWKFIRERRREIPEAAVAVIPDGRVWGPGQAALTPDNILLGDLSKTQARTEDYLMDPADHPIFDLDSLDPPLEVDGTAAVLSAPCGGGFYHWMIDSLPRLHLLERAGYPIEAIDRFVVNQHTAAYQRESLEHLGVPRAKLIESHWHPHIRAETLLFPTLPGDFGHPPRWACEFLRATFETSRARPQDSDRYLYLNRTSVTHRRVCNEREIIALLEDHRFRNVALESMSLAEQARTLAAAEVVCAPHGAALTGLVFCNPGVKVIELLSPNDVSIVFWSLADALDLDYYYLVGVGERPPEPTDPHQGAEDILVDVGSLAALLDRVLTATAKNVVRSGNYVPRA